jgi:hypothetical protein
MKSYDISPEILPVAVPGDSPDQIKHKLYSNIRKRLLVIDKSAIEIVHERMGIASDLKSLHDAFDDPNSDSFYQFLDDNFRIKKRHYQYYQSYFKFLTKYPLFQRIPVAFSGLCLKTGKIESWFASAECSRLSINNITSTAFWSQPNYRQSSNVHNLANTFTNAMIHCNANQMNIDSEERMPIFNTFF